MNDDGSGLVAFRNLMKFLTPPPRVVQALLKRAALFHAPTVWDCGGQPLFNEAQRSFVSRI